MASSPAKKFSLLLLFTLLSCPQYQARDSRSFSRVSAAAATSVPDQEQVPLSDNQQRREPNFIDPENENGYGLYGREAGKLPASTDEDRLHRGLPINYKPVAYVTEPEEDARDDSSPDDAPENSYYNQHLRKYYKDAGKSDDNQQEDEDADEPEQDRSNNDVQYYGGSSFNSGPQGLKGTRLSVRDGEESGFRPQGMSDTRSLENGKYFYDIKSDRYGNNHPYEVEKRARANNVYSARGNYGASENSMRGPYQRQYEFQNEGSMP